jgi:hypothetical protein
VKQVLHSTRICGEDFLPPSPAGSEATEDVGQRYMEDERVSALSDNYPAGLHPHADVPCLTREAAPRTARIDVRFAVDERRAVIRRTRALGVKPSAWVRAVVLDALDGRRVHVESMSAVAASAPAPDFAQAVDQLRRVGVNLNQVVRSHNRDGAPEPDAVLLREVLAAVDAVRARLGDGTSL